MNEIQSPPPPPPQPEFCEVCGHFGCPSVNLPEGENEHLVSPCGSYLCCVN